MKCNYKRIMGLNAQDRKYLEQEMAVYVKNEMRKLAPKIKSDVFNNFMKVFCVSVNETYGFGGQRIIKLLQCIEKYDGEINDSFDWCVIDNKCKKILGEDLYKTFFHDIKLEF